MTGTLAWQPAAERPDLLAPPVASALAGAAWSGTTRVAEIDPDLADTAAFCAAYGVAPEVSANCVVLAAKRAGTTSLAACVVLAITRADVNRRARHELGARKVSFAPVDRAVAATGMEFGGITPVGLPAGWPVLVDAVVAAAGDVVVGSGLRRSKLLLPGAVLAGLADARVIDGLGVPVAG
ncbi:MAG TPA: YbaK/EbsC family protein [Acidimicrobiales bacterium]